MLVVVNSGGKEVMPQINPELLQEWKKRGELLIIWRCDRCYKKIPFYKENDFIDAIHLWWARDHKFCDFCENKLKNNNLKKKKEINRINILLKKYEFYEDGDENGAL